MEGSSPPASENLHTTGPSLPTGLRVRGMVAADRAPRSRIIRNPAVLVTPWDLTGQPRSPKGLGHGVAGGGDGVASAWACFGGSQTFLRFRWGGFGARRP